MPLVLTYSGLKISEIGTLFASPPKLAILSDENRISDAIDMYYLVHEEI